MRSRTEAGQRTARLTLALVALLATGVMAQGTRSQAEAPPRSGFEAAEIARAANAVKADPNLATERTIKTLRWRGASAPRTEPPARFAWLRDLVRWMDQSARLLMWAFLAVIAAVVAAFAVKALNGWTPAVRGGGGRHVVPTHVQELDIRPETLPDDIGGAARLLWDGGDQRASLALLYRGLLSRLAHVYELPIRDSSTEGDCLVLATRLSARGAAYSARLIATRQASVYGHAATATATVHGLCDEFGSSLDRLAPEPTSRGVA